MSEVGLPREVVHAMLDAALKYASRDPTQPRLNGVMLATTDDTNGAGDFVVAATNGHQIIDMRATPPNYTGKGVHRTLVSIESAVALHYAVAFPGSGELPATLYLGPDSVGLCCGTQDFSVPVAKEEFPDYPRVLVRKTEEIGTASPFVLQARYLANVAAVAQQLSDEKMGRVNVRAVDSPVGVVVFQMQRAFGKVTVETTIGVMPVGTAPESGAAQ